MIIKFHKKFDKHYAKLNRKIQIKVYKFIEIFKNNPFDPIVQNHPLSGQMKDKRAFYVTDDIRIIFEEYKNYTVVLMLDVGIHNQVYQ